MYPEIPLWLSFVFILGGLWLLAWSANKFVDGASAVAKVLGISPFVIGMVVIGFGTSAPELAVSAISSSMGHSNLSLGNAYGSNVFNIAVILAIAALIRPVNVRPMVAFVASPLLVIIAVLSCLLVCLGDGFSRMDGIVELLVFAILLPLYCWFDRKSKNGNDEESETENIRHPWIVLLVGLVLLAVSSHILVWGSVSTARALGVSELLIGLTIIAAGTSLPELAAGIASARKGQPDFVLGNVIGSNFFNTLAVVGLSGTIHPFANISPYVLVRDLPVMVFLSLSIGLFGMNYKNPLKEGRITRWAATAWLLIFIAYMTVMFIQELS